MTGLATALGRFLAPIVRELARVIIEEWRKPVIVKPTGFSEDLDADLDSTLERLLDERKNDKSDSRLD